MKTVLVETKKFLGLVYPHANDLNEHKSYAGSSNQNKPKFMVAILRSQYLKDILANFLLNVNGSGKTHFQLFPQLHHYLGS